MDTLGEIFNQLRLTSTLHWRTELFAPWGLHMESTTDMVFHIVEHGSCWLQADGLVTPLHLSAGDLVILPHGPQHLLLSDLSIAPNLIYQVQFSIDHGCQVLTNTGTGLAAVLCGIFRFAHGDGPPLEALLPPIIYCPQHDNSVMLVILDLLADAARSTDPGATLIQSRLADILFVQALRLWLAQNESTPNWLNALRDRQVGTALGLMHRQPEQAWTVARLAQVVGLSRSAFSARFTAFVGQPPMHYLAAWRIAQVARELRSTDDPLTEIGARVGYVTIASLSKAFKQQLGVSPRLYRAQQRHQNADVER